MKNSIRGSFKLSFGDRSKAQYEEFTRNGQKGVRCVISANFVSPEYIGDDILDKTGLVKNSHVIPSTKVTGTGIAVVDERDTYDFELGKKIAYARAEISAYNEAGRIVSNYVDSLLKVYRIANSFFERGNNCEDSNLRYVDKVGGI